MDNIQTLDQLKKIIENDGENITLRTLFDIVERGLGGRLKISFEF